MAFVLDPMALELDLPWHEDEQREKAFIKTLKAILIPLLVLFVAVPFLPILDRAAIDDRDMPVRTQVLLDPIAEPEPAVVEPEPVPTPPQAEPEPEPPAPAAPVVEASTPPPAAQSVPEPVPEKDLRQSLSESQGLAELSNQLTAARTAVNIASMQNKNLSDNTGGEAARAERARLGQDLSTRTASNTAVNNIVMESDITQLAAHQTVAVEGLVSSNLPAGSQYSHLSTQTGQRDMESIRRTLEQAKGNVYTLYQRALQEYPGLTGEFTFKLVIAPDGSVSDLQLLVSELGVSDLERNILARIQTVKFREMDVPPTVVEYRFVFLPS